METPIECYAMADQCERQAATVKNERAREILLGAAASWRKLGDDVKKEKEEALNIRRSSSGSGA